MSGSSTFVKSRLNIWKLLILKLGEKKSDFFFFLFFFLVRSGNVSYSPIGQGGWSWVTAGFFQVQNSPGTGLSPVASETASASLPPHLSPTTTLALFSCIKEKSQIFYLAIFITFLLLISIQVGNAYLKKKKKSLNKDWKK